MLTVYDAGYLVATPVLLPYFSLRYLRRGEWQWEILQQRLSAPALTISSPLFWLHSVSVGETVGGAALASELEHHFPDHALLISTVTQAGNEKARQLFRSHREQVIYFPLDLSWVVHRFLQRLHPQFFITMETELWPNFLLACGKRAIPCILANGRLGEHSLRRYRMLGVLFRGLLRSFRGFLMQTEEDAARIIELGAPRSRVFITGNCKLDFTIDPLSHEERRDFLQRHSLSEKNRFLVAGSTHPGEEQLIAEIFSQLRNQFPELILILAPRHLHRLEEVKRLLSELNLKFSLFSGSTAVSPEVVLVDQMGILGQLYSLGEMAIVGGSFIPTVGGHNILEPACHGVPVIYGPYMHKQRELTEILGARQGGLRVPVEELHAALVSLSSDAAKRRELGTKAQESVCQHQGSARRSAELIKSLLCEPSHLSH